jgi:hypothetical protein
MTGHPTTSFQAHIELDDIIVTLLKLRIPGPGENIESCPKAAFAPGTAVAPGKGHKESIMRKNSTGVFALLVLGGFYLYRNRFAVQQYLESIGIRVPLFKGDLGERLQSGISKVSGKIDHVAKESEGRQAI